MSVGALRLRPYTFAAYFCCFSLLLNVSRAEGLEHNTPLKPIQIQDAANRTVQLKQPARRIVALAPHIVENLFAAGAGDLIVGVVDYANFPIEAKKIPSLGAIGAFSLEKLIALKPDLVILWQSARGQEYLSQLTALNIPVYVDESDDLQDIATSIRHFGLLTHHKKQADKMADQFEQQLKKLQNQYAESDVKSVFYQVWNQPLQTINDHHTISAVIRLCGGHNVFGRLSAIAPVISIEAVLNANPEVIIASGMDEQRPEWLDAWKTFPELKAVKNNDLYFIPPDVLQRQTPRILQGAEMMCRFIHKD